MSTSEGIFILRETYLYQGMYNFEKVWFWMLIFVDCNMCCIMCFVFRVKHCRSDLKLVNNCCKGRWRSAAVIQQAHTSIIVADISGENQKFCFSRQVDVCNPLALLPEWWRNRCESVDGNSSLVIAYVFMSVFTVLDSVRVSPVSDSILQLGEDSAVQGVNIRQLIENLSKPLFV